ncbi:unnamed protein product [Rotaria sp. Silwood2]|nr:unnamed protein product [Rotaria sp. Silwood2]
MQIEVVTAEIPTSPYKAQTTMVPPVTVSNELKINVLSNIQCAEFGIPSCYYGSNDSVHLGKSFVPFLSTYVSQLQTLYLWRPDDFAWASI